MYHLYVEGSAGHMYEHAKLVEVSVSWEISYLARAQIWWIQAICWLTMCIIVCVILI